jgi:heme O synthase-like polyprenyltransferase
MRPKPMNRSHTEMRPYLDRRVTWRGVGLAYGMMLFVLGVVWAVSYPLYAAALLAVIVGGYVLIRLGTRIVRRRAHVVRVPGTDVSLTIGSRQLSKRQ